MDVKLLLSVLNRPWFFEPGQAQVYAEYAAHLFRTGGIPSGDQHPSLSQRPRADLPLSFRANEKGALSANGPVRVIRINYPIAKYDFCYDPGSQTLERMIHAADADESVQSIVLWIDSPGGQVDGTESLAYAVRSAKKPVVAYSDGMMCSAAYWIASSARETIVHGANNGWNATVGSIGTMVTWKDESGKYDREGIKVHTVFASASTDKWGTFLQANAGNYAGLIRELDGLNDTFLAAVKENRAGKLDLAVENVLTGKTYNAREALKFGLIDKIGDFNYAVKRSLQLARASSSNTSTTTIMKFPNTMAAAKADKDFEVRDEGILLTAEQLGNVEEALTSNASTLSENATKLTDAGNKIAELNGQINTLTTQAAADQKTISDLRAEVERLGKLDAGDHKSANSERPDDFGEGEAESFETSYDRELKAARG